MGGPGGNWVQALVTSLILFGPLAGVVVAVVSLFGHGVDALDLILAVAFYLVSGHGVTAGYHRMFAHRGFVARRWTKIALCAAGSLAFEGSVLAWVAHHRRHQRGGVGEHAGGPVPQPAERTESHGHGEEPSEDAQVDRLAGVVERSRPCRDQIARRVSELCLKRRAPRALKRAAPQSGADAAQNFVTPAHENSFRNGSPDLGGPRRPRRSCQRS